MSSALYRKKVSKRNTQRFIELPEEARKIGDEKGSQANATFERSDKIGPEATGRPSSKKRKRSSPFRIKVGCVVALRYRPGGNHISVESANGVCLTDQSGSNKLSSFSEVWANPQPGRDEGLALIGCRIRCCFPKRVLSANSKKRATTRLLEGEVISIVGHSDQMKQRREAHRRREAYGTTVDLLIDKARLEALPFLVRTDPDIDLSQLTGSARRAFLNEERVRGENKAVVRVVLRDSSGIILKKTDTNLEAKWAIRKRIPTKKFSTSPSQEIVQTPGTVPVTASDTINDMPTSGEQNGTHTSEQSPKKRRKTVAARDFSAPRYLGDGNDSKDQQENNWRWQASKYDPFSILREGCTLVDVFQLLSYNWVGEVIRIEPSADSNDTLATVTIKRLVLPEHTKGGRLPRHGANEVFEDFDSNRASIGATENGKPAESYYYKVPIEELVIISKQLNRSSEVATQDLSPKELNLSMSYSFRLNQFVDISESGSALSEGVKEQSVVCSRCKQVSKLENELSDAQHWMCKMCDDKMATRKKHCQLEATNFCDCPLCEQRTHVLRQKQLLKVASKAFKRVESDLQSFQKASKSDDSAAFFITRLATKYVNKVDFSIDRSVVQPSMPSAKPIVGVKARSPKNSRPLSPKISRRPQKNGKQREDSLKCAQPEPYHKASNLPRTGYRPICSRLLPYDVKRRRFELSTDRVFSCVGESRQVTEKIRNLRLTKHQLSGTAEQEKEEKMNSRAARANQRRLLRGVAAIGVTFDALSGREQQLRFDRSSIHAWGVFADEDIKEGEMLVEYRGEIIGNSVAEKRETEYEDAKIGSDYMFRVDGLSVCDATKQGNVARFINASCDPNCYTKIISIDGTKRIAVYAKRDIAAGEELCYDYKFPLEYDESKRIPCHCGARDCRGFMNWVSELMLLVIE